jgi:hypothetical protein
MGVSTVFERCGAAVLSGPAALVVSVVLLAGCAGMKTDYQVMRERAGRYVAAHPGLAPGTAEAIRSNRIRAGMTMEQVIAAWGRPVLVRRFGADSQLWYFGCGWPHACAGSDEDTGAQLAEEIFESRAQFDIGRVVEWRD